MGGRIAGIDEVEISRLFLACTDGSVGKAYRWRGQTRGGGASGGRGLYGDMC
jgi:hypothetical protein